MRRLIVGLALLSVLTNSARGQNAPRRDRSLITVEEIERNSATNAYDVIRSLRPAWLVPRSRSITNPTGGQVVVYVDGVRVGSPDELRNIPAPQVKEARYLSAPDATTRFGTDHPSGAIEVATQR